ncbi:MAG: Glutamine amidotransferase [Spartobacteria bacterium]|nr:Glutamine amidotransferase [Spartobacteria bacterium]
MPNLATWLRPKDEKWFRPFFNRYPEVKVWNALNQEGAVENMEGLLLTGGSDIAPEFLRQDIPDPSLIDQDVDRVRDRWEFDAIEKAMARHLPIFAICKGLQVFNVVLGGTLRLDIKGHNFPDQKDEDIQPLRNDRASTHRFDKVNSSHHQAIDQLGEGCVVEAWCENDDIIEQIRLVDYPFALAVQYHPERGKIYEGLFDDFFSRMTNSHDR